MLVYLLFIFGLALLLVGGDWLVKGSVGLAEKFGVSPLIIGLTIVALGTSAPELVISLSAALSGSGGLAVGNVVGSNIANVLLVLGVPAIIASICCAEDGIKPTLFFLVGLTIAFMVLLANGPLTHFGGLALLMCLVGFLTQQFVAARRQSQNQTAQLDEDYLEEVGTVPKDPRIIGSLIVAGLIALPVGANIAVDAAVEIATRWNIPKEIIGLTVVAIGTSLPELATGIMAARQGNASVAIGNVIGSNLLNIAAIMGITATVAAPIPVSEHMINFDMWVMLAATLLLAGVTLFKLTIDRRMGIGLVIAYFTYIIVTAST